MNAQVQLQQLNKSCHGFKGVVISSQAIFTTLLSKFEITPAEFLRPFFQLSSRVRMRLGLAKDRQVDDFCINLLDRQEYGSSDRATLDRHTRDIFRDYAPNVDESFMGGKWNSRVQIDLMLDQMRTPWFNQSFVPVGDYSSHQYNINFLDQPLVIIYMVSGSEPDILKEIVKIRSENEKWLKAVFNNNQQDLEQVKKIVLVMNDAQDSQQFTLEEKLKKEFPSYINKILIFNQAGAIQSNIWEKYRRRRLYIQGVQSKWPTLLDDVNLKYYKLHFEEDILQKQIIPLLERNINLTTEKQIATKTKISEQFFNLWNRDQKNDQDYVMTQREYLNRYLGDMHFLLQEYDTAYGYYKELISEFRNNKTKTSLVAKNAIEYQQYSKLLGESGMSLRLQRKERDEIFTTLEDVFLTYQQENQFPQYLRLIFYYIQTIHLCKQSL